MLLSVISTRARSGCTRDAMRGSDHTPVLHDSSRLIDASTNCTSTARATCVVGCSSVCDVD
jgi:hypothetical protein